MADKVLISSEGAILRLNGATNKVVITSNGLASRDEAAVAVTGRIMSSLAGAGGLAGKGGIAGAGGGLAG